MPSAIDIPYVARRVWGPELYQGGRIRRRFFEGWYFKCVDAGQEHPVAVIPSVSYSADGRRAQSFVQLIRPGGHARFFEFPASAFTFAPGALSHRGRCQRVHGGRHDNRPS